MSYVHLIQRVIFRTYIEDINLFRLLRYIQSYDFDILGSFCSFTLQPI